MAEKRKGFTLADLYKTVRPAIAQKASQATNFVANNFGATAIADAIVSRQQQPEIDRRNAQAMQSDNLAMQAVQKAKSQGRIKQAKNLLALTGQRQSIEGNLGRNLTTPEEARDSFTNLAGLATMGYSAPLSGIAKLNNPALRLGASSLVRGIENAAPGVAVNLATGRDLKETAKRAGGDVLMGGAINTALSPKLLGKALKPVGKTAKRIVQDVGNQDNIRKAVKTLNAPIPESPVVTKGFNGTQTTKGIPTRTFELDPENGQRMVLQGKADPDSPIFNQMGDDRSFKVEVALKDSGKVKKGDIVSWTPGVAEDAERIVNSPYAPKNAFQQGLKARKNAYVPMENPSLAGAQFRQEPGKPSRFYRGGADSSMPKGMSAEDVIRYEKDELGNLDIKVEPGIDLKKVKSDKLMWLTEKQKDASQYGKTSSIDLDDYRIVARDGEGGVLVDTSKQLPSSRIDPRNAANAQNIQQAPLESGQRAFVKKPSKAQGFDWSRLKPDDYADPEKAAELIYYGQERQMFERSVGKDTIKAIQRVLQSKAYQSGKIDAANFPVQRLNEIADDIRRRTGNPEYDVEQLIKEVGDYTNTSDLRKQLPQRVVRERGGKALGEEGLDDPANFASLAQTLRKHEEGFSGGETKRLVIKGKNTEKDIKVRSLVGNGMPAGIIENPSLLTKLKRTLTSGNRELQNQGKSGKELAETILSQRTNEDMLKGKLVAHAEESLEGLSKQEKLLVTDMLEGKIPLSGRAGVAATKIRTALDAVATKAGETGLEIKLPDGTAVPFKARDNYFPHIYDMSKVAQKKNEARYLQHLIDSGQAKTEMEARQLLDNFLRRQGDRRAGNLENARIADLPDYEKDPLKALEKYYGSVAKRLTEVSHYGKKDDLANKLIERVRQEGGDASYAQEVFDIMVGNKQYENKAVEVIQKFNIITKLDLAFLTNMTQSVNTAARTGVINTLSAMLEAYNPATATTAGRFARTAGAVDGRINPATREGVEQIGSIMEFVMKPFTFVENKNRTIAAGAGRRYTQQVVDQLMKNPQSKAAIRHIRSVGLDPEKLIAQGGPTPDDILKGAKAISDQTQFKTEAIDIPPGWKTNIGRLVSQFQSFSFKQGIFLRDQVLEEAKHGNMMPAIRLIALGVPASYAAATARSALTGREVKEEEKSLDVRKLDYYTKAIGSIPIDKINQASFLRDTYNNRYATPLKKVGRTASSVFGPTVGEAFSIIDALEQIGSQSKLNEDLPKGKKPTDPYLSLKRIVAGYVPLVGERIKNTTFAFPKDNKSDFSRLLTAMKANDEQGIYDALSTYKPESWGATMRNALEIIEEEGGKAPIKTDFANPNTVKAGDSGGMVDRQKQAMDLAKAKLDVSMGKKTRVETPTAFVIADPDSDNGYRVVKKAKLEEDKRDLKMELAKQTGDYKTWETYALEDMRSLIKESKTLDPEFDFSRQLTIEKQLQAKAKAIAKYRSYGGAFKKAKKGRKVKKPKVSSVSTSTLRLAKPTKSAYTAPKVSAPRVRRAKVKKPSTRIRIPNR